MTIEFLQYISIGSYIAAAVLLAAAVVLFFVLNIPAVIGDLTGRTARKAIEDIRNRNETQTEKKDVHNKKDNKRQNSAYSFKTQKISTMQLASENQAAGNGETVVLDEGGATTVLNEAGATTVLNEAGATTVLNEVGATTVLNEAGATTVLNEAGATTVLDAAAVNTFRAGETAQLSRNDNKVAQGNVDKVVVSGKIVVIAEFMFMQSTEIIE